MSSIRTAQVIRRDEIEFVERLQIELPITDPQVEIVARPARELVAVEACRAAAVAVAVAGCRRHLAMLGQFVQGRIGSWSDKLAVS